MAVTTISLIEDCLAHKRLAMVGVSHDPKDFSRSLFRDFQKWGYDIVPVHSGLQEVEGQKCYVHVQDIQPPVDWVILMTGPSATNEIVKDCVEAKIPRVWIYGTSGKPKGLEQAIDYCQAHGIRVVAGFSPHMFIPAKQSFTRRMAGYSN